jgi:2-haloacid dehalogenase
MTNHTLETIDACVFDAYGTLFDVGAAAARCRDALGGKADELSEVWRRKQLEYTWLRSLMGAYEDFWHVTAQGLDYAMAALKIDDPALRARLLGLYMELDAYPEVKATLSHLKERGMKTAILSNGSPSMLMAAVKNADIFDLLDDVLSVDKIEIYKPHPSVYQLVVDGLDVEAGRVCFLSSNAWDVCGGAYFGFRAVWINRFGQPAELLPGDAEQEIHRLDELPPLLGLDAAK